MDPPDKTSVDDDINWWQTATYETKRKLSLRGSDSDNSLFDTESDSDMESFPGMELSTGCQLPKTENAKPS